jgi:hypothetical protein
MAVIASFSAISLCFVAITVGRGNQRPMPRSGYNRRVRPATMGTNFNRCFRAETRGRAADSAHSGSGFYCSFVSSALLGG